MFAGVHVYIQICTHRAVLIPVIGRYVGTGPATDLEVDWAHLGAGMSAGGGGTRFMDRNTYQHMHGYQLEHVELVVRQVQATPLACALTKN